MYAEFSIKICGSKCGNVVMCGQCTFDNAGDELPQTIRVTDAVSRSPARKRTNKFATKDIKANFTHPPQYTFLQEL
jgi:hypothetical protein